MKLTWKKVFFFGIAILLVASFFFRIIPIPVENIEGGLNTDQFIFGGFYWTSILHQLTLGNYLSSSLMVCLFGVFFIGGNLKWYPRDN